MEIMGKFKILVLSLALCGCSIFDKRPRELVLRKDWVRQTWQGNYNSYRLAHLMSPIVYKDMVIQGNAIDGVTAYHRKLGHVFWRFPTKNGIASGAQESDGKLYFGASDGQFYCLDIMSGRLNWSFPTRVENLAQPLVADKVVYFLSGNDTLYALDANTGKQKWVYVRTSSSDLSIRGGSRPVLVADTLYVGFADGYLVALHARDGTIAWERQINTNNRFKDVDSTPVIDGNNIYVSGFDNALYSLTRQTGQTQWRLDGGSSFPVTVDGATIYYSTSEGKIRAVKKETGTITWETAVKSGIATQPIRFKDYLVYGETDGALRVTNPSDGKSVVDFYPRLGVNSTPLADIENNRIYFMSNQGNLYSLLLQWERAESFTKLRATY
jgi:outer membrane protein assembly factor BamB